MRMLDAMGLSFDDVSLVPQYSEISSRTEVKTGVSLDSKNHLAIPLISSPMDAVTGEEMAVALGRLGGMGVIHRFMEPFEQANVVQNVRKRLYGAVIPVAAAVGISESEKTRVNMLVDAGVDVLCVDVAHGDMKRAHDFVEWLARTFKSVHVMSGSIATSEGARRAYEAGCSSIRAHVGSGSSCSTRVQAATGVPTVTVLKDMKNLPIPVISDGGSKYIGDVAKAIGLGATAVMSGSLFSGTTETPGRIHKNGLFPNEKLYKAYRGSASYESKVDRGEAGSNVEGVSQLVPYRGDVNEVVAKIVDGLRSAMSYSGAKTVEEFHDKAVFIRVSSASQTEAQPHGLSWNV